MKLEIQQNSSCEISKSINTKSFKLAVILIGITLIYTNINSVLQPLPANFEQPWKYRFLCVSSEMITYVGKFFEMTGITDRLTLTRIGYHIGLGVLSIRDPKDSIQITDEMIDHVPIRIFRPPDRIKEVRFVNSSAEEQMKPTIIFYHGGGFFVGSADTFEPAMYRIANNTNCLVIYVEYRLIPEFKYPAPLDDCLLATKHLIKNHKKYKIDLDNFILMGDSAGGNLAAVISQSLIENKIAKPKIQVLIYPILQFFDFTLPAYRTNMPKRILGQISHENFLNFIHYLTGHEAEDSVFNNGHTTQSQKDSKFSKHVNVDYLPTKYKNHYRQSTYLTNDTKDSYKRVRDILLSKEMSPLLVEDDHLIKYTPHNTILITAEMDILRDDGFIYAGRLNKLGLNIEHQHYQNLFHGIFGLCYGPIKFDGSDVLIQAISKSIIDIVYQ